MSLTIPYNSQAGIQVAGGGRSGPHVSASAFVTPGQQAMPGAVDKLLGGANKLVGVLHAEAIRKRKEQMELSLLEELQGAQSEEQAWVDTYRQQYQGKEAVNAEADAQAFYKEKLLAPRLQRWEGNDYAQRYIQRHVGGMAVAGVNAMRDYGNAQQEAWKDSVFATETARASDVLSDWRRTPEEKQAEWSAYAGKQEAYYQSKGLDPTAARIKTDRIYRDAVAAGLEQRFTAKLNNGDIAGAERDYDVMAGKLPEISDDNMQSVVAAYADHPNARAFLNFIARSEGTAGRGDDGYNISYGGSAFGGYDKHPNVSRSFRQTDGKANTTTAAGRYQFLNSTYEEAAQKMGLGDFSPRSQDLAALYLIAKRGALKDVIEGNAEAAIEKLGKEWASLPSSPYAQPKHSGQNAAAMLEAAGFTRGGMVSPEKLRGMRNQLETATKEQRQAAEDQVISQEFNNILKSVESFPPEVQDTLAAGSIANLPPGKVQNRVRSDWEAQRKIRDEVIETRDAALGTGFLRAAKEQGGNYGAALGMIDGLRKQGLSEAGAKKLRERIEKGEIDTITHENSAAANEGYQLIDLGGITGPQQIETFAFNKNLTFEQVKGLKEYLASGGQQGTRVGLWSKVDNAYKTLTGKSGEKAGLKSHPDFFESFMRSADMDKLHREGEAYIRRHAANMLMDGDSVGGGFLWGDKGETYSEAVNKGRGDTWLPEVSDDERAAISAMLRNQGVRVTDARIRQYKKHEMMKIPGGK